MCLLERFLALAQCDFRLVFLGYIAENQHNADNLTCGVADRGGAVGNLVFMPVLGQQECVVGKGDDLTVRHYQLNPVGQDLTSLDIDDPKHVGKRATRRIGKCPARQMFSRWIHPGDPSGGVGGNYCIPNRIQCDDQVLFTSL